MGVPSPRLPETRDLEARFRGHAFGVSIAGPDEYGAVEALSRAADPADIFLPLTADLLTWFNDRNPSGPGFVVLARASDTQEPVGHFLFYPTTLVRRNEEGERRAVAYLYVHLYVGRAWRRRGIFATMFAFGLEVLQRMGVDFAYTVPNPRSSPGFVKFGIPQLGTLPVRMAPAWRVWDLLGGIISPGRIDVSVDRVTSFDESMLVAPPPEAAVRGFRSVEQLNWRFTRRPDTEYGIWKVSGRDGGRGYVVTRSMEIRGRRVLAICDVALRALPAAALRGVVATIRRRMAVPFDLVMLQGGPQDGAGGRRLARAGLVHVSDRLLPQPVAVFGGPPAERHTTGGFPMLDRWWLTPCDWDVF